MNITRGKMPGGKKFIIYGVEGIGKTTLAARFPDPVFIDTEDSTKEMDVRRFDKPTSWQMLLQEVDYIRANPHQCRTLVIDTADWAEKLEIEDLCARMKWDGLEASGYGRGYQYSAEEFGKLLDKLSDVAARGVNVVLTAHAWLRKIELPEELGAYDHWEMKTTKKVAPMLREWADNVLFANYKTVVVNVDGKGTQKGRNKAQGGKRVLYTSHNPCWDAKNRLGMPEEMELSWEALEPFVCPRGELASVLPAQEVRPPERAAEGPQTQGGAPTANNTAKKENAATAKSRTSGGALGKLYDLMDANGVTEDELMAAVAKKGYFPKDVPLEALPEDFVESVLVGAWRAVFQCIKDLKGAKNNG